MSFVHSTNQPTNFLSFFRLQLSFVIHYWLVSWLNVAKSSNQPSTDQTSKLFILRCWFDCFGSFLHYQSNNTTTNDGWCSWRWVERVVEWLNESFRRSTISKSFLPNLSFLLFPIIDVCIYWWYVCNDHYWSFLDPNQYSSISILINNLLTNTFENLTQLMTS